MNIPEALSQLDPAKDDHWTTAGLPRVDVVAKLAGVDTLTREQIMSAAPEFCRTKSGAAPVEPEQEEPLSVYDAEIRELAANIHHVNETIQVLEGKRRVMEQQRDHLVIERDKLHPKPASTDVTMAWQRAQHLQRKALATGMQGGGAPMSGRSDRPSPTVTPIDKAFAERRPGLGEQRPQTLPPQE